MRIIFFFFLFIPFRAWSQACTGATITGGVAGNTYNCTTLTISAGSYTFPANADYVRVIVTGDVIIESGVTLILKGGDGVSSDGTASDPGGVAGPGGSDGGDNPLFTGPQSAPGASGGAKGTDDAACGGGGGGGGFSVAGTNGSPCGSVTGGTGGPLYNIAVLFRGGFGGGAGGNGDSAGDLETGTGGGAGGGIWISAGGDITLNGVIDVRGGKGGNGQVRSGGGGGGSGGAIKFQATGEIINNATFLLSGGAGGNGSVPGGNGGAGADGIYIFEDADNIVYGTGTGATAFPGSSETFHSAISCGAVKMNDDHMFFQVIVGFFAVIFISRIRGRFRRSA
jgi:hypothetical protein